jgi:hypothetical protein
VKPTMSIYQSSHKIKISIASIDKIDKLERPVPDKTINVM